MQSKTLFVCGLQLVALLMGLLFPFGPVVTVDRLPRALAIGATPPSRTASAAVADAPPVAPASATGGSPKAARDARPAAGAAITITESGFVPEEVTVGTGSPVTWSNATAQARVLVSGSPIRVYLPLLLRSPGGARAGAATVSPTGPRMSHFYAVIAPGGIFSHTFTTAGTYPYYDATAPSHRGRVIVERTGPPPDPGTIAPPLDPSAVTDFAEATAFLYTGPDAIQVGVQPGTLAVTRVAVLRGAVRARDGSPLPEVTISALGHPEYGHTESRADGMFDLAVNGGGTVTLDYQKPGYLPAQRKVDAPWRDFAWLPDVVLIPLDPRVTAVDLAAPDFQVVQGSVVADASGMRQATLLVPPGTQATMTLPGGTTQPLTSFHVRATEYTVGERGPQAMPGELPPQIAYTYALEYSVDEAQAAGALTVAFSQPLIHYSENFVGFPVGMAVPSGYYDRGRGEWVASDNGRVVKVLGVSGGLADLDTDGDGAADNGSGLAPALTDSERAKLAVLYQPGATFWRVPVPHFSPLDDNWPGGAPADAVPPPKYSPRAMGRPINSPEKDCFSIIGCEDQSLGERVSLPGTPFSLFYSSDRQPGRTGYYGLHIPLSGPSVPGSLIRIDLLIAIAGQEIRRSFPRQANQSYDFAWDGRDAYGRRMAGAQPATVRVQYVYPAIFRIPDQTIRAWGVYGGARLGTSSRGEAVFTQEWTTSIGRLDAMAQALGGWTLTAQHAYDPLAREAWLGYGEYRSGAALGPAIHSVELGYYGVTTQGMTVAPDGSLYIADSISGKHSRILRRDPDGQVTVFAGGGNPPDKIGDGLPATQASLNNPWGVAVAPDGSVYISDAGNHRIRRVGPDGIIRTVAGGGSVFLPEGVPATATALEMTGGLAVAPDGAFYFSEPSLSVVMRVGPDGTLTRAAGKLWCEVGECAGGDGGPAREAQLNRPWGLALGPDGSLYIADYWARRVRRVSPDGVISTVAGGGTLYTGYGGPATQAALGDPRGVAVGSDGSLYIAESSWNKVSRVDPDGLLWGVAGNKTAGYSGDGGPAATALLLQPAAVAVSPDGQLYVGDSGNQAVRKVALAMPGFAPHETVFPSEDGREAYVFNARGRHLRTVDALTGALRYQFTYDPAGRLSAVSDGYGYTTVVQRDAAGAPTAIVGPYGARNLLSVGGDGYLASITDPAGGSVQLGYAAGGLLDTLTDARGGVHHFAYDSQGRLIRDENPDGGVKTLSRTDDATGFTISVTTALSRTTTYRVERDAQRRQIRTTTDPAGARTQTIADDAGRSWASYPDGTVITTTLAPDPRWGMLVMLPQTVESRSPGGRTVLIFQSRSVDLAELDNPLSLLWQQDTVETNGHTYSIIYQASDRTVTQTTPEGRQAVTTLDVHGKPVRQVAAPGLDPFDLEYDATGRLTRTSQGTQSWTYAYNAQGYLASRTDALGRQTRYDYDQAGRAASLTLPSGRAYGSTYDAAGNPIAMVAPGGAVHALGYSPSDLLTSYLPPGGAPLTRLYDLEQAWLRTSLAGGSVQQSSYDAGGRPTGVTYPEASTTFAYAAGDPTDRVSTMTRTPAGGGLAQASAFAYDGADVIGLAWSGPAQADFHYTYDANSWLTGMRLSSGADVINTSLAWDGDGLLTAYGPFQFTRGGPLGAPTAIADGSLAVTLAYDSLGRANARSDSVAGQPVYQAQLARDAAGRIITRTEIVAGVAATCAYSYDPDGRLTEVQRNGTPVERYTYDARGNRSSRRLGSAAAENYTYDLQDRLLQRGSTAYQVDSDGFLVGRGADSFRYSARGELLEVTAGGQTVRYAYDALGRRVARTDGSGTTQYLYGNPAQGLQITAVRSPAGELTFLYYGPSGALMALERAGQRFYVATDQVGTPRVVSNASGQAVKVLVYDAFGNLISDSNPAFDVPLGFAGGLEDRATGLVRFGLRDYEPASGRWTARDPALFEGRSANLYAYVGSNPISLVDPAGLFSLEASAYDVAGLGIKLGLTRTGFSFCWEFGFGVGGSVAVDPFADLDAQGDTLFVEGTGQLGAVKGKIRIETGTDPCSGFEFTPEICLGPICMKGDNPKAKIDPTKTLEEAIENLSGVGLQVKGGVRTCTQHQW